METSLRYGGDSKALRIHAKEKLPIHSKTLLQVHGELDTRIGAPSQLSALIKHFIPELYTSIGAGGRYSEVKKLFYVVRGKTSIPFPTNSLLSLNLKGRCDFDDKFKQRKPSGAIEFSWGIFNFREDQDVRLKVGYEVFDKVPYVQIRENNWTLNADINGKWNVRFDM